MWKRFWLWCIILRSLIGCSGSTRKTWPSDAPIPLDTTVAILRSLYLRKANLNNEGLLTPQHDTLWHTYTAQVLQSSGVTPAHWDSLRHFLRNRPELMIILAESTLARMDQ